MRIIAEDCKHSITVNSKLHTAAISTLWSQSCGSSNALSLRTGSGLLADQPGTWADAKNLSRGCPGLLALMETMRPGLLSCMKTRSMCGISWGR